MITKEKVIEVLSRVKDKTWHKFILDNLRDDGSNALALIYSAKEFQGMPLSIASAITNALTRG